jgi:16S rRNA A1518/A1519 N6-dimethyltransferase RsmA/KsgA/DIM1 with predicted DNA glycosylase/AP lyase activity
MEARSRELREALFAKIDAEGYEDDKGNITLELDSAVEEVTRIEKQRRVTRKLDESIAEELIKERGIEDAVYKTIRVIDEDALMAQMYEGHISEEDIDQMFPSKVVWALMTKKK